MTTLSELRGEIERKNEEITQVTRKIETRLEEVKDWQTTVQKYPFAAVGFALGLGVIFSGAATPLLRFAGQQAKPLARSAATAFLLRLLQEKRNRRSV